MIHVQTQVPTVSMDAAKVALQAAIAAQQQDPTAPLSPANHALYLLIRGNPELKTSYLHSFLPLILQELQHYANEGALDAIAQHQILTNLYLDVPEIRDHKENFCKKMAEASYPWVGRAVRRVEAGVSAGMQIGNEEHLIATLRDLQSYVAVTGDLGVFAKLRSDVSKTLVQFYRKKLVTHPGQNPLKVLERKQQLDRLVEACNLYQIFLIGLDELQKQVEEDPSCRPLCSFATAHAHCKQLERQLYLQQEGARGVDSALSALKTFRARPLEPSLRRAIERGLVNVPGVLEWRERLADLSAIANYAMMEGLVEQIAKTSSDLDLAKQTYDKALASLQKQLVH